MASKIFFGITLLVASACGGVLNRLVLSEGVPFDTYGPPPVAVDNAFFRLPAQPGLPEGLPTLPSAPIIPVRIAEVSAPYPASIPEGVPSNEYGPPAYEHHVFVPKVAPVLPEGLPSLPAAPVIPVRIEEVSAPYPASIPEGIPSNEYGPPAYDHHVFVPKVAPVLPEGLPSLPAAPVIPVRIEEVSAPYPASIPEGIPSNEYGPPAYDHHVFVPKVTPVLPEGLPSLPAAPVIPVRIEEVSAPYPASIPEGIPSNEYGPPAYDHHVFVPKVAPVLPEGLPSLPAAPVIPVRIAEVSAPYPASIPEGIPSNEYGPPAYEHNVFIPKVAPVLPEGLPSLPAAPVIPVRIEEVSAPYPASIPEGVPSNEYGPPAYEHHVFVPKVAPVLPEGLPSIPAAPVIPVRIEEVSAPYPAALPASTYGAPLFVPKAVPILPEGLPSLPEAPIVPVRVQEVSAPYPAALPASTYGAPATEQHTVFIPKVVPTIPEGLPSLPEAPIVPIRSAPYPAALPASTYGAPIQQAPEIFVSRVVPEEPLPSFPYPAALPASSYGQSLF